MTRFIRIALAPLALAAVLTACGKNDEAVPESRQVELTPKPVAQAQLGDTAIASALEPVAEPKVTPVKKLVPKPRAAAPAAAAPTQAAPQPAPVSASAAPATGLIAGGMSLGTTLGTRVCTNTHTVGDRVTATLSSAVPGTTGAGTEPRATSGRSTGRRRTRRTRR